MRRPKALRAHALPLVIALAVATIATGVAGGQPTAGNSAQQLYIVVADSPPLAAYEGGIAGLAATSPSVTGAVKLDATSAASRAYRTFLAREQDALVQLIRTTLLRSVSARFRYDAVLNGFAVSLTPTEAARVALLPGVDRVVADSKRTLLTDNGPAWIGAPAVWSGAGTGGAPGTKGEGVVVGVIDTGINTNHPSFADVGGDGYNHTNPRGRFYGLCTGLNALGICNDKLIGVWDFTPVGTGEDENGHGSHTASTSAGNVLDASLVAPTMTLRRDISGVAPHANVIAYKACVGLTAPAGECVLTALLAAINQATLDGVDVINYSIGGSNPTNPWSDEDSLAFLNARRAGIFVSASAGNDGPGAGTVGTPATAPWLLTVGAATHDRRLVNAVDDLTGGATTPPPNIEGKSLTAGVGQSPIVDAASLGFPLCGAGALGADGATPETNPFPPGSLAGKVILCERGTYGRVAKGQVVKNSGAVGMILMNDEPNGDSLTADAHVLPAVHISYANGLVLRQWLASGSGHTGKIRGTVLEIGPENGDETASFSSRGPNGGNGDLLKPDVTAPGVDILAAFSDASGPAPQFGVISGTSMSSPHAAGAAALVRALHPTWTPDEVRSALMTTAFTTAPGTGSEVHDVLKEDGSTPADAFDMGAGRIDLRQAGKAGLVLAEDADGYINANPAVGGDPKTLNLPSMADDECDGTCFWTRALTSTASGPVTWTLSTSASPGMSLSAAPGTITIQPGQTRTIVVTAGVDAATPGQWHFGQVFLTPSVAGIPKVHLPVAVLPVGEAPDERPVLHFHGNAAATGSDHESGHPGEGACTGDGKTDLIACSGPFLLQSSELSPSPPASWKGGPTEWQPTLGGERTIYDPSWIWCLRPDDAGNPDEFHCPDTEDPPAGTTTLDGPMTVKWWVECVSLCVAGQADWHVRLYADGALVVNQQVVPTIIEPGTALQRLEATVDVPRTTAEYKLTLNIEPVFFLDQNIQYAILYDSTQPCPGAEAGPCDSVVHLPIIGGGDDNLPPIAAITTEPANATVREGGEVAFDGGGSTDDRTPAAELQYEWDFQADGIYDATGPTAQQQYPVAGTHPVRLRVTDAGGLSDTALVLVRVEPFCPTVSYADDLEATPDAGWQVESPELPPGSSPWTHVTDIGASSPSHSWFSDSLTPNARKDDRLLTPVTDLSAVSRLTFWHRFGFEAGFDGGVLEVSTDGGASWRDVVEAGGAFLEGGYNDVIDATTDSAIAGRHAWSGGSPAATAAMQRVVVDVGAFAGEDVRFRFRLATDALAPGEGWWIDDFEVTGIPTACNRPPVANDDFASTIEGTAVVIPVLANDSDPDGDALTVTGVTQPGHGSVTTNGTTVTYTPATGFISPPDDTFQYTLRAGEHSVTANVSVTVNRRPNRAPTASDDSAQTQQDTPVEIDVLGNDTDPDGDALTVVAVGQPQHGAASINAGGTVTYTPNAGYLGTDTFDYRVADDRGGSDTATVTVTVEPPPNEPPTAQDDAATTQRDTAVTVNVIANDSDPNGDPLTVTAVTQPAHGTVANNGGGTVTYTPAQGYAGSDSFSYTIGDGRGGTDTANVTVTVTGVANRAPVARNDSARTERNRSVTISVLRNDSDPDGDALVVEQASDPPNGTVRINRGRTVSYTPERGFVGTDTFTYTISDGKGGTSSAQVTITVKKGDDDDDDEDDDDDDDDD